MSDTNARLRRGLKSARAILRARESLKVAWPKLGERLLARAYHVAAWRSSPQGRWLPYSLLN